MESVDEPPLATETGLNEAAAPTGIPLALRRMEPLNPFKAEVLRVKVPLVPGAITREFDAALRLKSGITAVPSSAILWGLPGALSEMETIPARVPALEGVNAILIVQFAPAASAAPQLLVCE